MIDIIDIIDIVDLIDMVDIVDIARYTSQPLLDKMEMVAIPSPL